MNKFNLQYTLRVYPSALERGVRLGYAKLATIAMQVLPEQKSVAHSSRL